MRILLTAVFSAALGYLGFQSFGIRIHQNNLLDTVVSSTPGLFDSDSVLQLTITGKIQRLFNDRSDQAQYHPVVLSYIKNDSTVFVPLKARTRGNFRRNKENCTYPPILLNFSRSTPPGTIFSGMDKLKLVIPCMSESYVVREYLVYKLYNVLTPESFRARLVRVTFNDVEKRKEITFFAILLEDEAQMAKRNNNIVVEKRQFGARNIKTDSYIKMAMFQYMIGNTDWSTEYLHNTRLMSADSFSIPSVVPYDFDHSGIVNAPYANPAEQLELRSVQERRYRGYCITDLNQFSNEISIFNKLKNDFYQIYSKCPHIDAKYRKATLQFLDDFYVVINDGKKFRNEFTYPCRGSSNVTIKGLGKN